MFPIVLSISRALRRIGDITFPSSSMELSAWVEHLSLLVQWFRPQSRPDCVGVCSLFTSRALDVASGRDMRSAYMYIISIVRTNYSALGGSHYMNRHSSFSGNFCSRNNMFGYFGMQSNIDQCHHLWQLRAIGYVDHLMRSICIHHERRKKNTSTLPHLCASCVMPYLPLPCIRMYQACAPCWSMYHAHSAFWVSTMAWW